MTDMPEAPPSTDEEITVSLFDVLRRIALFIFAVASASIFAAVVIYTWVE